MTSVEICLASEHHALLLSNVTEVFNAGAQRIELCSAMEQQGLTPSCHSVAIARQAMGACSGLIAMIRPRAGDFCYSAQELRLMAQQIHQVADAGANGVVFGALTADGAALDLTALTQLLTVAKKLSLEVGLHRAFDAVADKTVALQQLIDVGFDRVLTSGNRWGDNLSAAQGLSNLSTYVQLAQQQIEIVIAGGVAPENAREILTHLQVKPARISLHAYASVLCNKRIAPEKVQALVNAGICSTLT